MKSSDGRGAFRYNKVDAASTEGEEMVAIKTQFDGEKIVLPDNLRGLPPQEVIIVYGADEKALEDQAWLKAQESTFAHAWDNDEDAVYDGV
ncbi:MAG TPA: hypothetical protein VFW73_06585 [Lacipirellulaceae bacterium]|nr:hypothetical protein [Lacipirellulaceae bacterium]